MELINNNISKKKISNIFKFVKIKKKYIKMLKKILLSVKIIEEKIYQGLHFLITKHFCNTLKNNYLISYIICFSFSNSNSFMQISNAIGNSKFFCSAGLIDLVGKQKISRKLVLLRFFQILSLLKSKIIMNKPIALHLKTGHQKYYKHLIIKKLKRLFFIKIIKTFNLDAYNGCRKRKLRRKR